MDRSAFILDSFGNVFETSALTDHVLTVNEVFDGNPLPSIIDDNKVCLRMQI